MENRIREIRLKKCMTLEQVAKRANATASQIYKLEKGDTRLTTLWMSRIAFALRCEVVDLLGQSEPLDPASVRQIPVIGEVAAGVWREAFEWDEGDRYNVPSPPDSRFPEIQRFALLVSGKSMDMVINDGAIAECVRYMDIGKGPEDGDYVVVIRRNEAGLIEATVKQYQLDDEGKAWLWPRSTDPQYQQPILFEDHGEEDHVQVQSRVMMVIQPV